MRIEKIGENLDAIMKARKMTQTELAKLADTTPNTIHNHITSGRIGIEYLAKYAECLGCTIADLTADVTDPEAFRLPHGIYGRYPWNLAAAVGNIPEEECFRLFEIYVPGVLKSLGDLTEREQKILEMRFKHYMTLEECGKVYHVTRDRIRQIEARALRKLRHPQHWKTWKLDTMDKAFEIAKERDALKLKLTLMEPQRFEPVPCDDWDIQDLELSVRSYNCLCRANIRTPADFRKLTRESLMKVRNLGRKSLEEVIEKLKERGIEVE